MSEERVAAIEAMRMAEKAQAMFYRRLAALAEVENRPDEAQRLHDLHADEQHHLSRLSALLIETLALALDPYPRRPGESLDSLGIDIGGGPAGPFAALEKLKKSTDIDR